MIVSFALHILLGVGLVGFSVPLVNGKERKGEGEDGDSSRGVEEEDEEEEEVKVKEEG